MKGKPFCEGIIRKGQLGVKYNLRWGYNAGDIFQGPHAFKKMNRRVTRVPPLIHLCRGCG